MLKTTIYVAVRDFFKDFLLKVIAKFSYARIFFCFYLFRNGESLGKSRSERDRLRPRTPSAFVFPPLQKRFEHYPPPRKKRANTARTVCFAGREGQHINPEF